MTNSNAVIETETSNLGNNIKTFDILEKTGLNWSVRKEDLITTTGLHTPNSGIFRNDNNEWLGTTSKKYEPFQNADMVQIIVEASEHIGLEVSKGGSLSKGKLVYLQMELKEEFIGNSSVKRYVTTLNSHNGRHSVAFGSTNQVVLCQNTYFKVYNELQKFRHNSSVQEKLRIAINELTNTIQEDVILMETFKLMDSVKVSDKAIEDLIESCFGIDINNAPENKRKLNKYNSLVECLDAELELEGRTMWGLFNSVTRYTNHYSNSKDKEEYVMKGAGYETNVLAYNNIVKFIEENTKETIPTK
jgi:phage/plasmid-like protein (TIGR03299 family)